MILNYIRMLHEPSTISFEREHMLSRELNATLLVAFFKACVLRHKFITVEHLLLGLLDDSSAKKALDACDANITKLFDELTTYINGQIPTVKEGGASSKKASTDSKNLIFIFTDNDIKGGAPTSTPLLQDIIRHTGTHALSRSSDKNKVSMEGVDVLMAIFHVKDSYAVKILHDQKITGISVDAYLRRE